jgi:L-ascorbate metabolism protein UlaG (beta-lactamase superfamily)
MTVQYDDLTIEWLGYATVRIEGPEQTIYLDPGRYGVLSGDWEPESERGRAHPESCDFRPKDGDLVCLTHVHHYEPDGIDRVLDSSGVVLACEGIAPRESRRDLPRLVDLDHEIRRVSTETEVIAAETPIWTVPAYNEPDGPQTDEDGRPFHPEGRGCGFLLSVDGTRLFWPGDTDVLAGHDQLDVDVFLPPIGGAFTMDREAAADLAAALDPDLVLPIHYNTFPALEADSSAFVDDLATHGIEVVLDE